MSNRNSKRIEKENPIFITYKNGFEKAFYFI